MPDWLAPSGDSPLYQQQFVIVDGDFVRGGYVLKHQQFFIGGESERIGFYHGPVSEALADKAFSHTGTVLLRDAMKRSPLLYCLGMGGTTQPLPRMLAAAGWSIDLVPFKFRMCRPARVVGQLPALRTSGARRVALDAMAMTGVATLGAHMVHRWKTRSRKKRVTRVVQDTLFPVECDKLASEAATAHRITAERTQTVLQRLYPATEPRFLRVFVYADGQLLGWAVCLDTQMNGHSHFADLRVGTIIDCDAMPGAAVEIVHAATTLLASRGVDLIISNQSAALWCEAFDSQGYLTGPSNFALALSKPLAARVKDGADSAWRGACHFTRGDGDGPIHL